MVDPNCAALDPIFWLHHGNIDRLWNHWSASGGGRVNPPDGTWNTPKFAFHDENGTRVEMSAAEVLDTVGQLGYRYDDAPSVRTVQPPPEQPPEPRESVGPPELVAATEEPVTLAGGAATVSLSAPPSTRGLVEKPPSGGGRILVSVDDIQADANPGIVYGVYLNLPSDTGEDRRRYHVGNVSLFGIEKMNDPDAQHEGAPGFRHIFDATSVVSKLADEGSWDPADVTVTFEPIEVLPPPGEEDSWDHGRDVSAPVAPVSIGRVSLFVQ
jgi:tyrosinase